MVFLKVIPTSLLFIHGSAGHCNLETGRVRARACVCRCVNVCVCVCVCDEFYKRGKGGERATAEKSGEAEKRKKWGMEGRREGGRWGGCGLEYGFGFPPLRGEWKAINTEAESKADRVAARGCTGTQREHDLDAKVTARPLTGRRDTMKRRRRR